MDQAVKPAEAIEVDPWTDRIGGLLDRFPRWLTRAGDWETRLLGEPLDGIVVDRPIYIGGLARSGSTILLELLAGHPSTVTHRYRDFPLVPVPWAWNWFVDRAGKVDRTPRERAHHDRIAITAESPEAFEEVLWMAFFPGLHEPGHGAVLGREVSRPRFEAFYRDHIRKLLLLRGGGRYLAKGNYNVTRIAYLRRLFPDARFVVPVRDPVWHVASLMKQHRLFCAAEAGDERIRRYMRRSGHFEFGLDRRAINVGPEGAVPAAQRHWQDGEEAAGWAAQWADIYGHVADLAADPHTGSAVKIVRYEDLCADPAAMLAGILDHCGLEHEGLPAAAARTVSPPAYYAPSFEPAVRDSIRTITAPAATRFGYG